MANKVDEIKSQLAQRLEKQSARTAADTPVGGGGRPPTGHAEFDTPTSAKSSISKDPEGITPVSINRGAKGDKAPVGKGSYGEEAGGGGGVSKISASLYDYDIECLDRIRDFMRGKGIRNITDSEALRLACRAVTIDDRFLMIYEQMSRQDGRRRNSSSGGAKN